MNPRTVPTGLAAVLLLALACAPASLAAGGTGAGTVQNDAATVTAFASANGATQARETSDVFTGTVRDRNGEATLGLVAVEFTTAPAAVTTTRFVRALVAADLVPATEPGSFDGNGWKVWNPGGTDGRLTFKFQYTWQASGTYVVRAYVQDSADVDYSGPAADLTITVTDGFTVAAFPVFANGTDDAGANWGAWTALPGQRNVTSVNFLKVTNSGNNASQSFVVDFTPGNFTGADGTTKFPLNNNIRFACKEGSATDAPEDLGFDTDDLPADGADFGSTEFTFSALGKVAFCMYNIDLVSDPLLDQTYSAAYTVS